MDSASGTDFASFGSSVLAPFVAAPGFAFARNKSE